MSTAICAASSPCMCPPRPSATAIRTAPGDDQWPTRSSLMSRVPTLLTWKMVGLFTQQGFLQRQHALRPAQVVELKAPVGDPEQLVRVLAGERLGCGHERVLLEAGV